MTLTQQARPQAPRAAIGGHSHHASRASHHSTCLLLYSLYRLLLTSPNRCRHRMRKTCDSAIPVNRGHLVVRFVTRTDLTTTAPTFPVITKNSNVQQVWTVMRVALEDERRLVQHTHTQSHTWKNQHDGRASVICKPYATRAHSSALSAHAATSCPSP